MTVLTIAQVCAGRLKLPIPATFIGSTSNNMILLKAMLEQAVQNIASEFAWPELQREHTFTLATSTDSYALPSDLDRIIFETLWNRDQSIPLIGPTDPIEWQNYKSGLVTTMPNQRFRIKGWSNSQFFIDPPPSSSENGQICVFEYHSKTCIRPKTWAASTSWSGLTYCSYNGNIYDRGGVGSGTTGTTPPTHTAGAVSDGSISWTYVSAAYETFTYDSDEIILNNKIVQDEAIWTFKRESGLDYESLRDSAEYQKEIAKTKLAGASIISVVSRERGVPMISTDSYPVSDY